VLAETSHKQNWRDEIIKHKKGHLLKHIKFYLYHSSHKYCNEKPYGIVYDEFHHVFSDKRFESAKKLKTTKKICLSATVKDEHKLKLKTLTKSGHIFTVPLKQAIEWGIIKPPIIYAYGLTLKQFNATETLNFDRKGCKKTIQSTYDSFMSDMFKKCNLVVNCTQQEKYNLLTKLVDRYKLIYQKNFHMGCKHKWLNLATERKSYLAYIKTEAAKAILDTLKDKRTIIFSESIKQSEELNMRSIHSKNDKELNKKILNDFNSGKTDKLFVIDMMQEGANLENICAALILQLDSGSRSFLQRGGRAYRAVNETPEVHILYYKNTQDEKYFLNSIEDLEEFVVYKDLKL